jgi:peptide/nickel transport system permease protein
MSMVAERWPLTIQLSLMTFAISVTLALLIGTLSALKQDSWIDYTLRVMSIGGLSIPSFWAGIMIVLALALWVGYMAPPGYMPITKDPWASIQQLLLPAVVLGWRSSAVLGRMVRSTTLEVLREDYIRTAHSKGLAQRVIMMRHVLRNASIPVVTLMGFQLGSIVAGTAVIETVFGLPGLGRLMVESIRNRDYPVVQFMVMIAAAWVIFINISIDILYGWLDPRIRLK